jgi:penicillin-binding protein 2
MKEACSTGGTGWPLFNFKIQNARLKIDNQNYFESYESTTSGKPFINIPVACKTGTAEFGDQKKTHAWITVFAPIENPQISITVLVESGGEGSTVAGPIAKKILEYWFSK